MNFGICFAAVVLLFFMISPIQADAKSNYNFVEEFIGGYRVQMATFPEFPTINEGSRIVVHIFDKDSNKVDGFTLGLRIFHAGEQIKEWVPAFYDGNHRIEYYVFENIGNHIVYVDLHDMGDDGKTLTYTFNTNTRIPHHYTFVMGIIIGTVSLATVIGIIYLPKI